MTPSTIEINSPVLSDQSLTKTKLLTFFTTVYLIILHCAGRIFTVPVIAISSGLVAPLRHLWAHYYPRVAFEERGVIMPHSSLSFIINALLALAEIKSQCLPGFPFQTHPRIIMLLVTSLLIYGLASTAENVVSAAGLDHTSVYANIVHLGKIGSLCILVTSLASLFYM